MNTQAQTLGNEVGKILRATPAAARERLAPLLVILIGIFAGLMIAVLVRTFLVPITNFLIDAVQSIQVLLGTWLPGSTTFVELKRIDPQAPGFDYGVGAFGAVFLLTKIQDIVATITELVGKWKTADLPLLVKAGVSLIVGFAALGLSVYGLERLADSGKSPTFVMDAFNFPPSLVQPDTGHLTFYIGFPAEGGPSTFKPGHASVTVSARDKEFLGQLKDAFAVCGKNEPIEVTLRGFASGSLWTTAEADLRLLADDSSLRSEGAGQCNPNSTDETDAARNALACIGAYRSSEGSEPDADPSTEGVEIGKAANVYLANRRRAAVAEILGLEGNASASVTLHGEPWKNHSEMRRAMVIDDSRADGTFRVKGILTRSVAITITHPSACSVSKAESVRHTSLSLR